ncbi:CIC11C00000000925 [Sungouiella intermedia]|uniref:CIC11C00000000925 n=1 Tax=Sungouiella intermedia TaxID=45354 RepID=A0A1L0C2C2_9ASCO|nr:CIC11C00000000925 [[Candida] intermedia]
MGDSQESVYLQFQQYDWDSFQEFQEGLSEILNGHLSLLQENDPSVKLIPPPQKQQLIDQAKLFFFCSKTGNILNLDDYYAWKRNNGGKITYVDDSVEVDSATIENGNEKASANSQSTEQSQDAPYSSNYQQLVDLIVSGKPVPGIKQIPDTVLSDQGSKLEAKSRLKPWEQKTESEENDAETSDIQEMTA